MATIKDFVKSHPAPAYFILTFAVSWGGVLLVIGGPGAIPGAKEQTDKLFPLACLAMLLGPSLAGILLTGLVHGRAGFRELASRLLKWRVGIRWYAFSLLTAPILIAAVLLSLSQISPIYSPGILATGDRASVLRMGIAVGLGAGFFEELGWTGFAIPRLRLRYGVLSTGIIVGSLWGAWHFLVNLWTGAVYNGGLPLYIYLAGVTVSLLIGVLPAYRVLMVWVYDRTGSLLVAMLMHGSLSASVLIFRPLQIEGSAILTYDLVLASALWLIVAAAVAASRARAASSR